jgi:hypothetical protein
MIQAGAVGVVPSANPRDPGEGSIQRTPRYSRPTLVNVVRGSGDAFAVYAQ